MFRSLRALDWRVLVAMPVLSVLLGVANNFRVPEAQRALWSGVPPKGDPTEDVMPSVERGAWTSDFVAATNAAATAHIPVVVVVMREQCKYCTLLHEALKDEAVASWQKKRNWYFVKVMREHDRQATRFVATTPNKLRAAPCVGVYWTHADGKQTMRNFTARQGEMGVPKEESLALEWMHAVEAAIKRRVIKRVRIAPNQTVDGKKR